MFLRSYIYGVWIEYAYAIRIFFRSIVVAFYGANFLEIHSYFISPTEQDEDFEFLLFPDVFIDRKEKDCVASIMSINIYNDWFAQTDT